MAQAIQKILQESELNDSITLQEVTSGTKETPRLPDISSPNLLMQLQQTQANVSVYETKGQNNKVNIPIIPTITTSQAPGLNENITSKSAKTPLNFSLQNVNTPSFVPQVANQSATRAEPGQYNTQLWPIQEENADIQKLQVELL